MILLYYISGSISTSPVVLLVKIECITLFSYNKYLGVSEHDELNSLGIPVLNYGQQQNFTLLFVNLYS